MRKFLTSLHGHARCLKEWHKQVIKLHVNIMHLMGTTSSDFFSSLQLGQSQSDPHKCSCRGTHTHTHTHTQAPPLRVNPACVCFRKRIGEVGWISLKSPNDCIMSPCIKGD